MLIVVLEGIGKAFKRWSVWGPLKGVAGGGVLIALTLLAGRDYLGLGLSGIERDVQGNGLPTAAFFWMSLATAVTLGSGGSGGIIIPIFFVGSAAGDLWGWLMSMDRGTMAALAGATNTPMAVSVMAIELFGPALSPYASVACVTSFLMRGHRSVYPSQIIGFAKSESLQVAMQSEIGEVVGSAASAVPRHSSPSFPCSIAACDESRASRV